MVPPVWFITGTSSGFGYDLTLAVLRRSDKVVTSTRARSMHKPEPLKRQGAEVLELHITCPLERINVIAKEANDTYGYIDVVVKNAGYGLIGALEEPTPGETATQFNTNVFGGLDVARAFLPYMRPRKTGTVVLLGSMTGWMTFPIAGLHAATKYAIIEVYEPRIPGYEAFASQIEALLKKHGVNLMIDVIKGEGLAKGCDVPVGLAIGTARGSSIQKLQDLKEQGAEVLELDVAAPLDTIKEVVNSAYSIYGSINVVVNNAGYVAVGTMEETTQEETLAQFNTNVFGALNVARACLPYMRAKKSGIIVWIGSLAGWVATPTAGLYTASKFALRGIAQTMDVEIQPLGLRSIIIEPGYFRTSLLASNHRTSHVSHIADYMTLVGQMNDIFSSVHGVQPGDPMKGVDVIIDVVKGEGVAKGKKMPGNWILGSDAFGAVGDTLNMMRGMMDTWKEVIFSTDFPKKT